jgi:hypothetical protein
VNDPHYGDRPDHTLPFVPKVAFEQHDGITKATMDQILEAETRRVTEATS